jgi:AcrR family transcriptional regulator
VSPRPRQASDTDILQAAFRAIARLGPAHLTLAHVAAEAGVSAAALVQRFGSKRALLLAAAADAAGGHVYIFAGLRAKHRSPVAALLGLADCMSVMGETPEAIAHSLAFLQIDLTDAAFLAHARSASAGFHAGISALVRDAIAAGELRKCDPPRLARALQATLNGSLLDWAIQQQGSMAAWIRRDLKVVLEPYRAARQA